VIRLIYKPDWLHSHATLPTPWQLDADRVRLFFSSRDEENRSHIGFVDMENGIVVSETQEVLGPGKTGTFDQHGVSPCCILEVEGEIWLYYLGWNLGVDVPFRNSIGLAVWQKREHRFSKVADGPILDRNLIDPFTLSYPFVLKDESGFRMWYGSHLSWEKDGFPMQHVIKYAHSQDGIHWKRDGHICLNVEGKDYAFSRPWVLKTQEGFEMYYCYRGDAYRLGYATSEDGLTWERKDHVIQLASPPQWAREMQCYPAVAVWNQEKQILFNGNQYGKTGVGVIERIRK